MQWQTTTVDLVIDGEWRVPSTGHYDDVTNPASPDETVGLCASGRREDARAAVDAAAAAQPAWARAGFLERAAGLRRMAEAVSDNPGERAQLLTRENGKTLKESMIEMTRLGDRFTYTADLAPELLREDSFVSPAFPTKITYNPFGVAALIIRRSSS